MKISEEHLSKPGLVVIDITAADEATAKEAATTLGGLWLSSGPSAPWRTPGQVQTANAATQTEKAAMTSSSSAPDVRCRAKLVSRYSAPPPGSATTTGGKLLFKVYVLVPPGCLTRWSPPPQVMHPRVTSGTSGTTSGK